MWPDSCCARCRHTALSADTKSDEEVATVRGNREIEQSVASCITYKVLFLFVACKGGRVYLASDNREEERGRAMGRFSVTGQGRKWWRERRTTGGAAGRIVAVDLSRLARFSFSVASTRLLSLVVIPLFTLTLTL